MLEAKVYALNGSGRSSAVTLEEVRADIGCGQKPDEWPMQHGHTVTIPGAAQAWCDAIENLVLCHLKKFLPRDSSCVRGFRFQITAEFWKRGSGTISGPGAEDLLPAPSEGSIFQNRAMGVAGRSGEWWERGVYSGGRRDRRGCSRSRRAPFHGRSRNAYKFMARGYQDYTEAFMSMSARLTGRVLLRFLP